MVQRTRAEGVVHGSIEGDVTLDFVSTETTVKAGDVVVTSGMGGVYPKGLVVGEVIGAAQTPSSLYQDIRVEPVARPRGPRRGPRADRRRARHADRRWRVMNARFRRSAALFVAAVLQAALAPYLSIGRVVPNFLLLVVVTLALVEGPAPGAAVGLRGGPDLRPARQRARSGRWRSCSRVTGYLAGLLHEQHVRRGLAAAAHGARDRDALGRGRLRPASSILLGAGGPFWSTFFTKMLPGAVYNTVLALLVYPWLARFLRQDRPMTTFRRLA